MFQRIRINGYFQQLGSPEIFLREFFFNNPTLEKQKRNNRHVKFEATEKRSLVSRNHIILEELETKGSTIMEGTSLEFMDQYQHPSASRASNWNEDWRASGNSLYFKSARKRNESQLWRLAGRYDGDERASWQGESSSSEKHRREVVRRTGKAADMWQAAMATRGALGSPPTDW